MFLDSTEILLSLEFNEMKCSSKPLVKQWAGSWTVEERSVLVFGTSVFGTGLFLKCSRLRMAKAENCVLNFCVIFTKARISGLSLDFSSGRIYGHEWLMCVITIN